MDVEPVYAKKWKRETQDGECDIFVQILFKGIKKKSEWARPH